MNSLLKVRSLLFAFTLISAAAPAGAITRIGNAEAPQVASTSGTQVSETASSATDSPILVARDWFGWERQDRKSK